MTERQTSFNLLSALKRTLKKYDPGLRAARIHTRSKKNEESIALSTKRLEDISNKSQEILFEASTVFPFNFIPDTIRIDREKITVANRPFFRTAKIDGIPIRDILDVQVSTGPILGSVLLYSRYFESKPISINFLRKDDATKLRRILQGYIIANEQKIDCSNIEKNQLVTLLTKLGTGSSD